MRHDGKVAIGIAAASMIQPGHVVIVDGDITSLEIGRHLPREMKARIVTHRPTIA